MYPTWLRMTPRHWTTTLLLLAIVAALIGGVQTAVAQPEPPTVPEQPARLLLPLMMNGASPTTDPQVQPQTEPEVLFVIAPSSTGATITTDQLDYPPGAIVTITGAGWAKDEPVHITVNDDVGQTWSYSSTPDPVAGSDGTFTYQFKLPDWFVAHYGVLATGPLSGSASTTFTDLSIGTYDQCSNDAGTGYANGDSGCRWINGNLQTNNSVYLEGDATVQRLWLKAYPAGSIHTITFKYGTTKGGKHAYDFLTTWDWSEDWITVSDRCQDIAGCETAAELNLNIPQDPNVPDSFEPNALGERQFVMRGGTPNSATTPAVVSGSYAGDSETAITVQFKVADSGPMCKSDKGATVCDIAIWFGAHVAAQANWGLGLGAGSIPGSPYHVALDALDSDSIGQRDNQMQANVITVIPNGTIVIVKDAVPNEPQDFSFNLNNNSTISQNFALDDDGDLTLPNSQTFSVPPGTWYATELGLPITGWDFTGLVCVDPSNNTTVNGAVATIGLASNETVTCTYTNTKRGSIVVKKITNGGDATFGYTTIGGNQFPASFNIATSGGQGSQTYSNVVPGAYSVAETPLAGWTLTSAACDSGTPGSFAVPPGGTVTCTFTNTRTYNKDLTVSKTAVGAFNRLYKWTIDKSVDTALINIAAGGTAKFNYAVKVTPDGFVDSSWAVSGKITVANSNGFAISGVSVADAIDNGGSCTVIGGTNVTVPANGSVALDYTCIYAAAPSPAVGTNTATATWDKAPYDTPGGSASGTAGVDFATVTPAEMKKIITVVDDKTDPTKPVTLGTWNWADGEHSFTYPLDKAGVAGTCTEYTNTAAIVETGQADGQKVTVCVGKDLIVSKTAAGILDRSYLWNVTKSVDQTLVKIADGGSYTFHYTVAVAQTGVTDANWTLSGKITLTNPNNWEDITVTGLTDAVDNGGTCSADPGPYVVPKSGSLEVNYSCSYASAPSSNSGTNTATATWDKATAFTPGGSASGSAPFTLAQLGSANKTVNVTDSYGGNLGMVTATDSAPFATATFTYDRTESGAGGKCTSYDNTATIIETHQSASKSVTLCVAQDLTVTKTAAGTFDRTYSWQISKDVDKTSVNIADGGSYTFHYTVNVGQTGVSESGWNLSGKITLKNPNNWEDITLTGLTDAVDNGGACTLAAGPYVVPKSGSLEVNYSCSYASAPSSYSGTNTATATWDKAAAFTPGGSASGSAPFTLAQAGSTNKTVHVTDSFKGDLGTVTATDNAPFASATFVYDRTEKGVGGKCTSYDNTATITESGQSASKTVMLCVGQDLTVTKTAAGTFSRTYSWQISKGVDQTSVNIADGGSSTFHYIVGVEQTGVSDSGWTLGGKITLSNPNNWEAITLTNLADVVDNGGTCILPAGPYVVPAGKTLEIAYSCSYVSVPRSYSGTNTATAAWDAAAAFTPGGSASGSAPFTLAQAGSTNKTVHVTDSYGGNLGTLTATDSAPFAKDTFTYDRTEKGVGGKCTTYDNTAKITETNQSASKSVTLCVGQDLTVTKTAAGKFDRTYLWKISKSVDKTSVNIADGGSYTFHYSVGVEQTGISDAGWTLSGKITLSNPNDWEDITVTTLSDVVDNGGACTVAQGPYKVLAGKTLDVNYTCTYTSAPSSYSGTNSATATWDKVATFTPTASAGGNAQFTLAQLGSANKTVNVTDSFKGNLGTVAATDSTPFASATFNYDRTEKGAGGKCTTYDNAATITETDQSASKTVTLCVGKDLTVSKTAAGTFDRTYLWKIGKDVDKTLVKIADGGSYTFHYTVKVEQTGLTDAGWTLAGTITLNNPNDWEDITLTSLADAVDNGGTCTVGAGPYKVLAGKTLAVNYSCSYGTAPSSYSGMNTVTATWDKATAFTPTGLANGSAAFVLAQAGAANKIVHVTDSYAGGLGTVTATDGAPFATASFTYDRTESGEAGTCKGYGNTAKIVETGQTAGKTVTLCVAKDLTVSKTAAPSFTRTWSWTIVKDYTHSYNLFAGDTVTHGYTVTVTPSSTDSNWALSGKITVSNPNTWQAITADVTDAYSGGGTCTVTGGASVVVPAGKSVDLDYSCTFGEQPAYTGKNTATATWDKAAVNTPNGTATGGADVLFENPQQVNQTISVDDDKYDLDSDWKVTAPTTGEWTYKKEFSCSPSLANYTDGKYFYSLTNTATIKGTTQNDTAKVDVTCYWPQIDLIKTGDALSKIGDGVSYTIKLENNTPTSAGLRDLTCSISDDTIGFSKKDVKLASGASDTSKPSFTIPGGASDPFLNTATVTCKPVAATSPVVGDSTFSVNDSSTWSTNLFQPAVEIVKTGPAYATSGDIITYNFTINNKSSSDGPSLILDTVWDDKLKDLADDAPDACDVLAPGASCSFTASYTVPGVGLQATSIKNIVTVHYHPEGFPNDITATDDHTVMVTPKSQLTDTSFCPLANNQFRLLYHLETAPNIYRLQASNPGQYYFNGFYFGTPGSAFTMKLQVPYPFMTQEGAGNPIQVHDGTSLTSSGCYNPNPSMSGFSITTPAMSPTSSAGNQIITPDDYNPTKDLGQSTTVTVSGKVPASGMVYVTIHLDYGLKKTGSWGPAGSSSINPISGASIADVSNKTNTIHGYEVYNFARTMSATDTSTTTPSSYNEFKKFAGFVGFVTDKSTGKPVANAKITIYNPTNKLLTTQYTDADGYYMYAYKHTAKAATYTVKAPAYGKSTAVTVKANGFAAVDYEVDAMSAAIEAPDGGGIAGFIFMPMIKP